jgi:hypothetical protein
MDQERDAAGHGPPVSLLRSVSNGSCEVISPDWIRARSREAS